jgi:hypothetical protein
VASGEQPLLQERVESGLTKTVIEHRPVDRFVINTHAFHNAHLLRATLPRSLVAPIPLLPDRQAKHIEIAQNLRAAQETKRAAAKIRAADKKLTAANDIACLGSGSKKRKISSMEIANGKGRERDGLEMSGGRLEVIAQGEGE